VTGKGETLVLVTIDTLRVDHLPFAGYPRATAPFLADLAEHSVVFDQAISASSHTAPSHASILTSLLPSEHRLLVNGADLDPRVVTVPEILREAGYHTAAFTPVGFLEGLQQGFEHFDSGTVYKPARQIVSRALAWLAGVEDGESVFLWVHLYDVHEWYHDDHLDHDARARLDRTAAADASLVGHLSRVHGLEPESFPLRRDLMETVNRYDAQLLAVDEAIERLITGLGELGRATGSVTIVTADHGEGLGNHGFAGHGRYLYEEQLHVPLLAYAADGRWPVGRIDVLVSLVDLAPTLVELAGAAEMVQVLPIEGRSLVPLLERTSTDGHEVVMAERRPADQRRLAEGWAGGDLVACRYAEHKLIVGSSGASELYDLVADPKELINRFDPAAQEDAEDARQVLASLEARQLAGRQVAVAGDIDERHIDELRALGYIKD